MREEREGKGECKGEGRGWGKGGGRDLAPQKKISGAATELYMKIKQKTGLKYIAVQHSHSKITVRYSRNAVR